MSSVDENVTQELNSVNFDELNEDTIYSNLTDGTAAIREAGSYLDNVIDGSSIRTDSIIADRIASPRIANVASSRTPIIVPLADPPNMGLPAFPALVSFHFEVNVDLPSELWDKLERIYQKELELAEEFISEFPSDKMEVLLCLAICMKDLNVCKSILNKGTVSLNRRIITELVDLIPEEDLIEFLLDKFSKEDEEKKPLRKL